MSKRTFILAASTHVDLAWKRGPAEMLEMLEVVTIRLLDALQTYPDLRYTLEQSAHYRNLAKKRPDLVKRLGPYLREGRLEMAGCMASTMDTNLPVGESFVRNLLLGTRWAKENWDITPQSGWLIDTFGINAQVPQILRQFGLKYLSANRLGGDKYHELMLAKGLDGTETLVAGCDVYSPYIRPQNIVQGCYSNWDKLDRVFADADTLVGDGPFMLFTNTENEYVVSLRGFEHVRRLNDSRPDEHWTAGTMIDFFHAVDQPGKQWPVVSADLNPEFTGCFSLRPKIRLRNRRAETLLLEAEKWACLAGLSGWETLIDDAWWKMAFVQFHDVFTGSHPTFVYDHVIETLDAIDAAAERVLDDVFEKFAPAGDGGSSDEAGDLAAVNGLPWERRSVVRLPSGLPVQRVTQGGLDVPFDVRGGETFALLNVPAGGFKPLTLERSATLHAPDATISTDATTLENEFIRLELDTKIGLRRLTWKPTGTVLMEDAGDLLIVQQDDGNFQIESPAGAEVVAAAGTMTLSRSPADRTGDHATLAGTFPPLAWAGVDARLEWAIDFSLVRNRHAIDMNVRLHWKGEKSRVRLKITTCIDAAGGIYEVPFGTIKRMPYGTRGTARGEWPAQRFVAIEDASHGVALANNGAAGVETGGGRIVTSLLRAPSSNYAGMVPDDSSSCHGDHAYRFTLAPYAGTWQSAGVSKLAQELNTPVRLVRGMADEASFVRLNSDQIVLSTIKRPQDGAAGEMILRAFETTGRDASDTLYVAGLNAAWLSDVPETRGRAMPVHGETVQLCLKPFEILTLRIRTLASS